MTVKQAKDQVNWVQWAAIVLPLLTAAAASYLHADRRITVLEERSSAHMRTGGHEPMMQRMRVIERAHERADERWVALEKKLDEIKAELRRR